MDKKIREFGEDEHWILSRIIFDAMVLHSTRGKQRLMEYIEERLTNEGFDPVSVYKYILNARHLADKHCYTDPDNNPLQDLYTIEFKILAEMAREFHPELVGIKNKNKELINKICEYIDKKYEDLSEEIHKQLNPQEEK